MARKGKPPAGKSVEAHRHNEAKRRNIPTAEYQSVIQKEAEQPLGVAYERRNRDLDPQLVWRGKNQQDWSDLVVQAPPLYIQEKVHPKALIDDGFSDETSRRIVQESQVGETPTMARPEPAGDVQTPVSPQAPEERIDDAVRQIELAVADELLERILQAPPAFFEQLVLDLLQKLGYGTGAEDSKRLGGVGDGGIDGIINLDRLGLEKVYVQAKRWQGSVGRPEVQSFFGALAGRRARKGVFITTSTFTRDAREYGEHVSESVVLIDGATLTRLMIENGVAVSHHRVVRLPRIDQDYFDTF
jgi:restriction endonuclease Mrr